MEYVVKLVPSRMKSKSDPKSKRCPLCKHRFPIVMLQKHLYRSHTKDLNLLELDRLFEKAIRRKSGTEKVTSIASAALGRAHSKPSVALAGDEKKKNALVSKRQHDVGKPHDCNNKISSQSALRYQNGLKKGLLQRAKMQLTNSKGVQSSVSTASSLEVMPIVENNHIWESRNLRTWDKYYSSYLYPNHHYKLVTMDEVKDLFNPNRKTIVVEAQVLSDAKGNTKQEDAVSVSEKGPTDVIAVTKSPSPKPENTVKTRDDLSNDVKTSDDLSNTVKTRNELSNTVKTRDDLSNAMKTRDELSNTVKTRDDLSDMDLHTSEDEVVEIKPVDKRIGYQPDCEDISSDEEWA